MRILALTNLYPNPLQPHRGTYNRQQLRALANRHEVAIISPIAWTDELSAWRKGHDLSPEMRSVQCDGLTVEHPRYLFPPKIMRGFYGHFFRDSIQRSFARALAEFRPDLILAAWAYPDGWAAVELGARAALPVVVKVHGSDILTLTHVRGRGERTTEVMRRADAVIAVSHDLAKHVVGMGVEPHRVSVIYDGIDADKFHPGPRCEARQRLGLASPDPVILFIGNLVPVKCIDVLIDACSRLARDGRKFRCHIIGQGPLREQLQQQIRQCGLADRITLVGPVAHARLPDWYRAADVFVLPSSSEGVPCVLLEAAACQAPYVATHVGGIPEIAHLNDGRLVKPRDPAALADAISHVLAQSRPRNPQDAFRRSHDDAAQEIETVCQRVLHARIHAA